MELPLYRISITEDDKGKEEVDFIALTDDPAIMSNFLAFSKTKSVERFQVTNDEERIVTGLALIADLPIYRTDKSGKPYYVVFFKEDIKQIAQKFFRKGYQFNFNEEHDPNKKIEGVYMFESWLVDRDKGKVPMKQFGDVANGSWIISLKIDNDKIWNDVKEGKFKGFSVEGLFNLEQLPASVSEEDVFEMNDDDFFKTIKELIHETNF